MKYKFFKFSEGSKDVNINILSDKIYKSIFWYPKPLVVLNKFNFEIKIIIDEIKKMVLILYFFKKQLYLKMPRYIQ